jgi:hypothetical protein
MTRLGVDATPSRTVLCCNTARPPDMPAGRVGFDPTRKGHRPGVLLRRSGACTAAAARALRLGLFVRPRRTAMADRPGTGLPSPQCGPAAADRRRQPPTAAALGTAGSDGHHDGMFPLPAAGYRAEVLR